ncbi:PH domain-containing protein [Paenibacillus sp. OSY-SE]|uniref:PH domain-containing protein n=1 Tax=Paenibacillus sp. OSY-SE TaxID=1196323 RepID=UPI0003086BF4|nr:PH domain-containing protein [Paenibacillus sp. OSY-SE]
MNKDTRLHPLFILFSLADTAKKLWPVLLIFLFKGAQNPNRILIIGGGVLFLFLMADVIKWRRFTYRVEADKLIIRHGLFMRDEKTIYFSRIHSVRVEQPLLQRLFGMAQLKIETPGGSAEADGVLPALTREAADQLRSMLMRQGKGAEPSGEAGDAEAEAREPREADAAPLPGHAVRMTTGQLFVAALSTMNFGLVLAFFAGIISFADDIAKFIIPRSVFDKLLQFYETSVSGPMSILITVAGALLLSWLLSTVLYIVKYYGFTAEQRDGDILITNGLFEKKMNIFKPERVQAIVVKEGLLRQALGYAEIEVRVLSADKKEALMLHPYVPVRQIPELLSRIIPGFDIGSVQHCAPRRAWWYYFRFRLLFLALAFLGLYWFQGPLAYWMLPLLPVLLLTGYLSFRDEGVGLQDRQLIVRNRIIARKTCYVLRPQIVALKLGHTYFQERKQLLSLTAHLLNGDSYSLTSLEERDLQEVWHWYRKKKR